MALLLNADVVGKHLPMSWLQDTQGLADPGYDSNGDTKNPPKNMPLNLPNAGKVILSFISTSIVIMIFVNQIPS